MPFRSPCGKLHWGHAPLSSVPRTPYIISYFRPQDHVGGTPPTGGCDGKLLNPLTDINGIRVLSRLGRSTRSSRAPHRHDSDARAFTRALYRGGRNHVGPANVLSCASRLQDPSPRHARRNRVDFRLKIMRVSPLKKWVNSSPQSSTSSFLPRLPIGYMFYLTN